MTSGKMGEQTCWGLAGGVGWMEESGLSCKVSRQWLPEPSDRGSWEGWKGLGLDSSGFPRGGGGLRQGPAAWSALESLPGLIPGLHAGL